MAEHLAASNQLSLSEDYEDEPEEDQPPKFKEGDMVKASVPMDPGSFSVPCDGIVARHLYKNQYGTHMYHVVVEWGKDSLDVMLPEFRMK